MPDETPCTAVVVSYNSARELPLCLSSLMNQRDVELQICVVDNASCDGSAEWVRNQFPRIRVLANEQNVGFGRANNQVLLHGDSEYYALVNPDTQLPPHAIASCIEFLRSHPGTGMVGTLLTYPDGSLQPSCHRFLTLPRLLAEILRLDAVVPSMTPTVSMQGGSFQHGRLTEVDWLLGAFLVVRGSAIRETGGFDPAFFMYSEEMDLCYRLKQKGWKIVFLPEPPVVHQSAASSRPIAGPMFVEKLKSQVRFLGKHRGGLSEGLARLMIAASVLVRAAVRESMVLGYRLLGKPIPEELHMRQQIFRAALGWVARGMRLESPIRPEASARVRGPSA